MRSAVRVWVDTVPTAFCEPTRSRAGYPGETGLLLVAAKAKIGEYVMDVPNSENSVWIVEILLRQLCPRMPSRRVSVTCWASIILAASLLSYFTFVRLWTCLPSFSSQ